jgi:hypothetical protein
MPLPIEEILSLGHQATRNRQRSVILAAAGIHICLSPHRPDIDRRFLQHERITELPS